MDLSRLSTLSLNNSIDIIANNISLINGNQTNNILDLFVLKISMTQQNKRNQMLFIQRHKHIRDLKLLIFSIVVITI